MNAAWWKGLEGTAATRLMAQRLLVAASTVQLLPVVVAVSTSTDALSYPLAQPGAALSSDSLAQRPPVAALQRPVAVAAGEVQAPAAARHPLAIGIECGPHSPTLAAAHVAHSGSALLLLAAQWHVAPRRHGAAVADGEGRCTSASGRARTGAGAVASQWRSSPKDKALMVVAGRGQRRWRPAGAHRHLPKQAARAQAGTAVEAGGGGGVGTVDAAAPQPPQLLRGARLRRQEAAATPARLAALVTPQQQQGLGSSCTAHCRPSAAHLHHLHGAVPASPSGAAAPAAAAAAAAGWPLLNRRLCPLGTLAAAAAAAAAAVAVVAAAEAVHAHAAGMLAAPHHHHRCGTTLADCMALCCHRTIRRQGWAAHTWAAHGLPAADG